MPRSSLRLRQLLLRLTSLELFIRGAFLQPYWATACLSNCLFEGPSYNLTGPPLVPRIVYSRGAFLQPYWATALLFKICRHFCLQWGWRMTEGGGADSHTAEGRLLAYISEIGGSPGAPEGRHNPNSIGGSPGGISVSCDKVLRSPTAMAGHEERYCGGGSLDCK